MGYQGKSPMEIRPNLSPMDIRFKRVNADKLSPISISKSVKLEPEKELVNEASNIDYPIEPPDESRSHDILDMEEEEVPQETSQKAKPSTSKVKPKR